MEWSLNPVDRVSREGGTNGMKKTRKAQGPLFLASMLALAVGPGCQRGTEEAKENEANVQSAAVTPDSSASGAAQEKVDPGSATGDAGASAGPKKRVFGAFEVNPDEPCDHCEQRFCTRMNGRNYIKDCTSGKGSKECMAFVECAERTRCHLEETARCYCGEVSLLECMEQGGTGPCVKEVEAAAESRNPKEISLRFADSRYAVGRAFSLISCKRNHCPKCNE